jgi:hypothetical protein
MKIKFNTLVPVLLLLCSGLSLNAQKFAADYLRGGISDGNLLLGKYLTPFGNSIGAGMNNGWYNTAETHKKLGFSLMLNTNLTFIPVEDQTFDVSKLNLQRLTLQDPNNTIAPTVFGDNQDGPGLQVMVDDPTKAGQDKDLQLTRFNSPKGIGVPMMPSFMVQGAVGLPKNTEIMVRYLPTISVPGVNGKMGLYGLGFKHDLKQWIPFVSKLPLDLAVMAGYTRINTATDINLQPGTGGVGAGASGSFDNQEMVFNVNALTANLIFSKKIAMFTPHISVGYNNSRSRLRVNGSFPIAAGVVTDPNSPDYTKKVYEKIENPIDVKFENVGDFRINAGFRFKMFGVLCLAMDYTLAKYSTFTLGLGVSVR